MTAPGAGTAAATTRRCALISPQDYGCWLQQGHEGKCEADASRLGAVSGSGPSCTRCGQPLIRWPSAQWADTGGMVVCQVSPGRYAAHDVHNAAVTAEQPTRARLTPAATAPGRAAYEAMHRSRMARDGSDAEGFIAWSALDETWAADYSGGLHREDMDAAAQAACAAAAPRCPSGCGCRLGTEDADARECGCDGICRYSFDEMTEILREGDRLHEENGNLRAERDSLTGRVAELVTEGNELRALVAEILGRFHYLHQDFMECDSTPDEYAGWQQRAGLSGSPDGGGGRDAQA